MSLFSIFLIFLNSKIDQIIWKSEYKLLTDYHSCVKGKSVSSPILLSGLVGEIWKLRLSCFKISMCQKLCEKGQFNTHERDLPGAGWGGGGGLLPYISHILF